MKKIKKTRNELHHKARQEGRLTSQVIPDGRKEESLRKAREPVDLDEFMDEELDNPYVCDLNDSGCESCQ